MAKRYRVRLTGEEQQDLRSLVSKGRAAAYKQTHARILLLSAENQPEGEMKDQEIARVLRVGSAMLERVRRRCVERVWRLLWSAGSNSIAARKSWTVRLRPT